MEATALAHRRLLNQHIDGEKFETPEEVVKWMGALQAQDYLQSLWAIGLRTQSATVADIEQAIVDRKILRTWPMRGTIHFVPPEDAHWMLTLSAPRMIAGSKRRLEQLELDTTIIEHSQKLFHDALTRRQATLSLEHDEPPGRRRHSYRGATRLSSPVVHGSDWLDLHGSY